MGREVGGQITDNRRQMAEEVHTTDHFVAGRMNFLVTTYLFPKTPVNKAKNCLTKVLKHATISMCLPFQNVSFFNKETTMFSSIGFANSCTHGAQLVTEATAVEVADYFLVPGVRSVELYGSVSRNGVGNDLDLIIVVHDEGMYQKFIAETKLFVEVEGSSRGAFCRLMAARRTLPRFDSSCHIIELNEIHSGITEILDVYLMPTNWRDRIDEIQGHLPHSDPHFVQNIANDARTIGTRTSSRALWDDRTGMMFDR